MDDTSMKDLPWQICVLHEAYRADTEEGSRIGDNAASWQVHPL